MKLKNRAAANKTEKLLDRFLFYVDRLCYDQCALKVFLKSA